MRENGRIGRTGIQGNEMKCVPLLHTKKYQAKEIRFVFL